MLLFPFHYLSLLFLFLLLVGFLVCQGARRYSLFVFGTLDLGFELCVAVSWLVILKLCGAYDILTVIIRLGSARNCRWLDAFKTPQTSE